MEPIYQINPELDVPIYQQLVDTIRSGVKRGTLQPGQQLPTVQEMSKELGIARGTIKRAYDELERLDFVEKVQGRGTFIRHSSTEVGSRKDRAMALIDAMFAELEQMGLSKMEIDIFLNLKLRQRAEQENQVKMALVECNPENLSQISEQLHKIPGVDLHSYLADSIAQYPYNLDEDMDLVITTAHHAQMLESILPKNQRVIRVALRMSPACLAEIFKLGAGEKVGVLCYSPRFGNLLYDTCATYTENVDLQAPMTFAQVADMKTYLADKDVVIVPRNYEKYCTSQVCECLQDFDGMLIPCGYELDEGSYLYLQEKTKRILVSKNA